MDASPVVQREIDGGLSMLKRLFKSSLIAIV